MRIGKVYQIDEWQYGYVCVEDNGDRGFFKPLNFKGSIIPTMLAYFNEITEVK